jgi:hypothetical protein
MEQILGRILGLIFLDSQNPRSWSELAAASGDQNYHFAPSYFEKLH